MKNHVFLVLLCSILFVNCEKKEGKTIEETDISTLDSTDLNVERTVDVFSQQNWTSYYSNKIPDFSKENFLLEDSIKISLLNTDSKAVWDKEFAPVYKEFLVYNSDSTYYVDIHSYKWQIDDKAGLIIGPDQEIVLGNTKTKKVNRLLFYGPSFWVEDAYFQPDGTLVLLENSTDKVPAYQEINLETLWSKYYIYNDTLDFSSDYLKNKILSITEREL